MRRKTRIRSIYRITGGPDAAAKAERIAARELDGAETPELVENVCLLLGEILADRLGRVSHVEPRVTIDVRQTGNRARWCVVDRGGPSLPGGLRSTALEEIADAWGVSRQEGMTRTWFELHTHGSTLVNADSDAAAA